MKDKMKVAVGISGGVDSAMAALILQNKGYEVIGLTMAIWDDSIPISQSTKSGCFGPGEKDDLAAAAEISRKLGIEHHIIKLKDEYRENVLSYFCNTYTKGKTPNPCLVCNQRMKFGLLPAKAKEAGIEFDYFATGHYVRINYDNELKRNQLLRAVDLSKDQSYFLAFLAQSQLQHLLFPLGELSKQEIKNFAIKMGYSELAKKQESQDFLESDDISVLFDKDDYRSGDVVDHHGKLLGQHKGIINFTIGQRRNIGIAGFPEPYYVIEIDGANNRVVLGPKSYLYRSVCTATNINWLSIPNPKKVFTAKAKIRLQHEPAECIVTAIEDNKLKVEFTEAQLSITPGQGIVFYDGDIVLAGGFIDA
ncbi:MAG: tRNA 2-thiouridine(34) synthase MnmA [Candidatus Cloacimonetes bacterium HGW-Cloacimonetes-3]|jgi:tRNA-specific 2-thiouridylase|nr:MAG: tRNA 2-thiouridine(34) synthase MnmA [Candidatus Cloacimonetes bacterium HGW-Cloacimonetes-3]